MKGFEHVLSVSEYLDTLNLSLRETKARIVGEVSGLQEYSGRSYLYFSIKDTKDSSTVKCFMWKNDYKISGVTLTEGMEVIVTAYPNVYKPNGGMTLQVEAIELVGEGALKIAYEKLKNQLASEGLFDPSRKKMLPKLPYTIGIITSKNGAVINDFLSNIGKYGFKLVFVDSKVEGEGAIKDLLAGLRTLYMQNIDVLVIMRGGGSLESFQAFNNEVLVRAITKFNVPVITGIGHDKDAPLVSLVSDVNVSTPTAVASLLNSGWIETIHSISLAEEKIYGRFEKILRDKWYVLENTERIIEQRFSLLFETFHMYEQSIVRAMTQFEFTIETYKKNLVHIHTNVCKGFERGIQMIQEKLYQAEKLIVQNNPERQLRLGWSISTDAQGKIIRSVGDVGVGEEVDIVLVDGILKTRVE